VPRYIGALVQCHLATADKAERLSWQKKVNREEAFIVGAARTPLGRLSGALSAVPAPALGAATIRGALERAGIEPEQVDYTLMDNVLQAGVGQDMAAAAIGAGIPVTASAMTANKVFPLRSHQRAVAATEVGVFRSETVSVTIETPPRLVGIGEADEGPRADTSPEALGVLAPAFSQGRSVTAGDASQISDGAAAVILAGESTVARLGLSPATKPSGYAHAGVEPAWPFEGPAAATRAWETKTGLRLADFDLVETNEAFAALALANGVALVSVHGKAVALGHPLEASGARTLTTLLHALVQRRGQRGLAMTRNGGVRRAAPGVNQVQKLL